MSEAKWQEERLTALVVASLIPSHPSTDILMRSVASLRRFLGDTNSRILVVNDGLPDDVSPNDRHRYHGYLQQIEDQLGADPMIRVIAANQWAHLSGSIELALELVKTEYVLVCQHDFEFIRDAELGVLLDAMDEQPRLRHVRFNQRANWPVGWDASDDSRRESFRDESVTLASGKEVKVTKTLAWSDNNHLCRATYYGEVVLPLLDGRRTYPEVVCNPLSTQQTHGLFGTYIFGPLGAPAVIRHLDGRNFTHGQLGREF